MGSIIPNSLIGNNRPTNINDLNRNLFYQKIGDALTDFGSASGNFGDKAANFGKMTALRNNQYQQEINAFTDQQARQQARDQALKQQQFMNNLAANRNKLAQDEYKLRLANLTSKVQPSGISLAFNGTDDNRANNDVVSFQPTSDVSHLLPKQSSDNNIKKQSNELTTPLITRDRLPTNINAALDRVSMNYPDVAKDALDAANYKLSFSDIDKLYPNSADRQTLRTIVRTLNPNYDPSIARDVEQFNSEYNNPKSTWAQTKGLAELHSRNRDMQSYAENVPSIGITGLNHVYQPIANFLGNKGLYEYEQALDQYAKPLEKTLLGGKPTVSSLSAAKQQLSSYLGPDALKRILKDQEEGFDKQAINFINTAYNRTHGYSGLPVDAIDPIALNRYIDNNWVKVDNNRIIPLINPNEFENLLNRRVTNNEVR